MTKKRTLQQIIREHLTFGAVSKKGNNGIRFFGLAMAGEAGELANNAKKEWRGDRKFKGKAGQALFRRLIEEETVDLGNYVFMMSEHLGIDLAARMERKLIEVEARDDDWNKVAPIKAPAGLTKSEKAKRAWLAAGYHPEWLTRKLSKSFIKKLTGKQVRLLHQYRGF